MKSMMLDKSREHGVVLIAVLWMLILLTIIAASFSMSIRRESKLVRNLLDATQARHVADAGIRHAMLELLNPDLDTAWKTDGRRYEISIGASQITVSVSDEAGRIDINQAPPELLDGLFESLGVDDNDRAVLVDAILDWRDADEGHRLNGPSEADYRAIGQENAPRNAPFASVEELQQVYGMTSQLYRATEPLVTIYSNSAGVDPASASSKVLAAVPGLTPEQISAFLAERQQARDNDEPAPQFLEPNAFLAGSSGFAYSVASFARLPDGASAGVEAVIARTPSVTGEPFIELRWKELIGTGQEPAKEAQ